MDKKTLLSATFSVMAFFAVAQSDTTDVSVVPVKYTITDSAIVYPSSFGVDAVEMMDGWYMKNYVDLDRDVDKRKVVSESDDTYKERLNSLPTTIEMPFNPLVKSYIEVYTQQKRCLVESALGMNLYYGPIIELVLEKEGIPAELKNIPVVCSLMNPNMVSSDASGLWLFPARTAKGEGLEINALVDERRDPVRSSEVAAAYLKKLHNIYEDWTLAVAAYFCGPNNVNKAIRRSGGKTDFWEIYPWLPKATRGGVPAFIAANYAMTYYKDHKISPALAKNPIITDSITVKERVHFGQISGVLNIPMDALRTLNPQYRRDVIPGDYRPYSLVLPTNQVNSYLVSEDSILNYRLDLYGRVLVEEPAVKNDDGEGEYVTREVVKYHTVRKGENLNKIAKKYGVTVASVKKSNPGIKPNKILVGQKLKVVTYKRVFVPKPKPVVVPVDTVTVKVDSVALDSISIDSIAIDSLVVDSLLIDSVAVDSLLVEREIIADDSVAVENDSIAANAEIEELAEPVEEQEEPAAPAENTQKRFVLYKRGDKFSEIAERYGLTEEQLKELNPDINPKNIRVGERVRVQ